MLPVLIAMISGMSTGYLLRNRRIVFSYLDTVTAWVIRLLLFLLGFGIGVDDLLLAQVPVLGLKGLVLAVSAIIGSVLAARLVMGRSAESQNMVNTAGAGNALWKTMGGSLFALTAFLAGLMAGALIPRAGELPFNPATAVLYFLMFLVGTGAGGDPTALTIMKKHGVKLVFLPLAVVVGTLVGTLIPALIWSALPIRESLAVGAGFGYYSLSSLLIKELSGGDWAAVALLSNISREILTLLAAPLLVRVAGPSAPAAAGGATSMDTTLAATVQCSGRSWTVPALFSGIVLTILTPFAVTFILTV